MNKFVKGTLYVVGGIILLGGIGNALSEDPAKPNTTTVSKQEVSAQTPAPSNTPAPSTDNKNANEPTITLEEFNKIKNGMTYEEVVKIVGGEGTLQSEAGDGQYKISMYSWEGEGDLGANANITFEGTKKKVTAKAQFGLK
jgi:hypothetical protein